MWEVESEAKEAVEDLRVAGFLFCHASDKLRIALRIDSHKTLRVDAVYQINRFCRISVL